MFNKLSEYGYVDTNTTFKDKTSFKIGGKIKYYIEVYDIDCLIKLIRYFLTPKLSNSSNDEKSLWIFCSK